jgi:uncharacterized protein YlzI (FlbEa/FlbD family)
MKFVTFTKLDGQPSVINLDHIVVLFPNDTGTRIVLSNGIDIYVKASLADIQRQIDEAPST